MRAGPTLGERCLLYLFDRADVSAASHRAEELVQEAIAEALRVQRAHVSRAMAHLRARGLVHAAKVHLRGRRKRVTAYFLTGEGLAGARAVRHREEERVVVVVDGHGRESRRRLYEVPFLVPRRPRFSEIVAAVREGRVDLRWFLDDSGALHRGRIFDVRGAIDARHFAGRRRELDRLIAFLTDSRARILVLVGLPGIGKTALASEWVRNVRPRANVIWRRLGPRATPTDLLGDLADVLLSVGRRALSDHLRSAPVSSGMTARLAGRELAAMAPLLLVLDDAHLAGSDLGDIIRSLALTTSDGPKVLLPSRRRLPFLHGRDYSSGHVLEIELGELPAEEASAVLGRLRVSESLHGPILRRFGGHPLSLELAARASVPLDRVRTVSVERLVGDVLPNLGEGARETLAFAAVFEGPVPRAALGSHEGELSRWCLLRTTEASADVHDLVREAVLSTQPPETLVVLHARAGELLAASRDPLRILEAIRHFVAARDWTRAAELAVECGEELIGAGYPRLLQPLLPGLARGVTNRRLRSRVLVLEGNALEAVSRWAEARRAFERAGEIAVGITAAEALLGRGRMALERFSRDTRPLLLKARNRFERLGAIRLAAAADYYLGSFEVEEGSIDAARDAFERGRAAAEEVGDRRVEAMCVYGIARTLVRIQDWNGAIDAYREAMRLYERAGDRLGVVKSLLGSAGSLNMTGRWAEAEDAARRGLAEAREIGAAALIAYGLWFLGGLHWKRGQFEATDEEFGESAAIAEEIGDDANAAACVVWLASIAWQRGELERGEREWQRAESLLEKSRGKVPTIAAVWHFADAARASGRRELAITFVERGMRAARTAREPDWVRRYEELQAKIDAMREVRAA